MIDFYKHLLYSTGRMKFAPFQKNMDMMKAAMTSRELSTLEAAIAKDVNVAPISSVASSSSSSVSTSQSWGKSPSGSRMQSSSRYVCDVQCALSDLWLIVNKILLLQCSQRRCHEVCSFPKVPGSDESSQWVISTN